MYAYITNSFVDEVQDHLMVDVYRMSELEQVAATPYLTVRILLVLQSLCSNLDGGYWCGDTAQTINIGSSFRIKDLKAYIYDCMVRD
jgi:hypothetical protein